MLASLRRVVGSLLVATLFLPLGVSASQVLNGDFETGDFTGWTVFNKAAIAASGSLYPPLTGDSSAVIVNYVEWTLHGTCVQDPWNGSWCEPPLPYQPPGGPDLTFETGLVWDSSNGQWVSFPVLTLFRRGSVIGQDLSVHAGDVLTWDWIGDGRDSCGGGWSCADLDGGGFYATNGLTPLDPLTYGVPISGTGGSYTFGVSGLWTIYFGTNQGDATVSSALTVDNVRLQHVPEPGSLALLTLGLVGLAFTRRRRQ